MQALMAESADWLQFVVSDPFVSSLPTSLSTAPSAGDLQAGDRPIAEMAEIAPAVSPPPQIPTPPASSHGSPTEEGSAPTPATVVSVSTTFYPGANLIPLPPDLVFLSSDTVFFYVHSSQVLSASTTRWKRLIPESLGSESFDLSLGKQKEKAVDAEATRIVSLTEPSDVLNIALHTVYGMSCAHYSPAAHTVLAAADALTKYGVPLNKYAAPGTPLQALFLSQAPAAPLEFYTLAARNELHELAVQVSSHLLNFHLPDLTDEAADKMGAIYLKRMMFLHLGRVDALKRLLLPPPEGHPATPECDFIEQKKLTRAWALASAYLAWDARADLSPLSIEGALFSLNEHLSCQLCKQALRERIKQLVMQWAIVKRTI